MIKSFVVDATLNNMRLDRFLRNKLGKIPQGLIEKKLRTGKIKLNKKKAKSSTKVNKPKLSIVFKRKAKKNLYCVPRFEQKYRDRPSPPYSAIDCPIGTIATGNDGLSYQVIRFNSKF